MTGIKPPGSDPAPAPAEGLDGPERAEELSPESAVDASAEAGEVAGAGTAQAADPVAQLAAQLQAGEIDVDTAVGELVERAMGEMAPTLSAGERNELESMLRDALDADPTLAALRADLEQA